MCNLYSMTSPREAVLRFARALWDRTGSQPPLPSIFPDQLAPVIRADGEGVRGVELMRWGFPPPPNLGTRPLTNVRNVASPYWRQWLERESRCLVPATAFCEYTGAQPKRPHWFALGPERPLFAFAGIWRRWRGRRKGVEGEHLLFAFLTTEANDLVRPVHARAMPVILIGEECDLWLEADRPTALALQRPSPPGRLQLVASGQRQDEGMT